MTIGLGRSLLAVAAAVLLGPLMAAIGLWLMMLVVTVADPSGFLPSLKDALAGTPNLLTIFIVGSYRVGAAIALIAGLLVAVWMAWRPPNLAVVLAASVAASLIWLAITEPRVFLGMGARENLFIVPPIAAFAGAACWFLLRRFARRE